MARRRANPNQPSLPNLQPKRDRRGRPKNTGRDRRVPHRERPRFVRRAVVGITLRLRDDLPSLRTPRFREVLRRVFEVACDKDGFAICQFSVQGNHLHMICEADHHVALARGMQGFAIRAAKAINKAAGGRKGKVFVDRYHVRYVKRPAHLRWLLLYVLNNHRRHDRRQNGVDPYSSARWFDGWSRPHGLEPVGDAAKPPVSPPRTRLLAHDWRYSGRGPIHPEETPPAAHR